MTKVQCNDLIQVSQFPLYSCTLERERERESMRVSSLPFYLMNSSHTTSLLKRAVHIWGLWLGLLFSQCFKNKSWDKQVDRASRGNKLKVVEGVWGKQVN